MKRTNDKGVTLLALAVTIIVLLILAGITMQMAFSKDSVVKKGKDAVILASLRDVNNGLETYLLHKEEEVIYDDLQDETEILHEMEVVSGGTTKKIGVFKNLEKLGITSDYGSAGKTETRTQISDPKADFNNLFYIDYTDYAIYYVQKGEEWKLGG